MNKNELIDALSEKTGFTKTDNATFVNALIEQITKTLKKGGEVQLVGFGTFKVNKRKARMGRNPQTGKAIKIPAKKVPVFKPGKGLRDSMN